MTERQMDPLAAEHTTVLRDHGPLPKPAVAKAGVCTRCKGTNDTDTGWCRACLNGEDERRRELALAQAPWRCRECHVVYVGIAPFADGRCHHCHKP